MRKFLLLPLFLLLIIGILPAVYGQNNQTCPRGIQDCRGLCGWYTDRDLDGFCDYTLWSTAMTQKRKHVADSLCAARRAEAEKKTRDSLAKINAQQNTKTNKDQSAKDVKQPSAMAPSAPAQSQQTVAPVSPEIKPAPVVKAPAIPEKSKYDVILILFACLTLYIFTFLLARRDVIKKATHRKIWNSVLLITFLVSGLLGLFLAIQLNYNLRLSWFASLLYWHVEFGIAMAGISLLHVIWHMKYWLNLFTRPGGRIKNN